MPRQLRIQYLDALDQVATQGDRREDVGPDDEDREILRAALAEACQKSG